MAKSAVIGALRVNLGLDSAQFQKGVSQAQGRVEKFAANVNNRLGRLGDLPGLGKLQGALAGVSAGLGAALGAAAAAGVAALGALSVSAVNAAGEIKNLSTLANAAPVEFQGWAAGAKSVGIEQDKLADILKDVNDRVGDFIATGGGPMVDFFERIGPKVGVTAEDFRKLSGPQALQLYVSSLEKANVNQQDFTFFMEAMASDATALVPLLKNGGKEMAALAARAEALGGVMSDRTVKALAGMKRSLGEVGTVMVGVRNSLGASFAPILQSLAETFVSLMTKGSGLRLVFDGLAAAIGTVARFVASLVTILSGLVSWLWSLGQAAAGAADKLTGVSDAVSWLVANSPIGWIYGLVTGFSDLIRSTGSFGAALSALGDLAGLVWQGIVDSAAAIPPGLSAIWNAIKRDFFYMIGDLQKGWADLLASFQAGLSSWGLDGAAAALDGPIADALFGAADSKSAGTAAAQAASAAAGRAKGIVDAAFGPMRDKLAELRATTDDAAAALDGGGGGGLGGLAGAADKAGGSAKKAADKLTPLQEVMRTLRDEAAKLKATLWGSATDALVWDNLHKAGVSAASRDGQAVEGLTRQIEAMKSLKAATDDWKTALGAAFDGLVTKGASFRNTLATILDKLAEMVASSAFDAIWNGTGLAKASGGFLSWLGIGKNANGTRNWRGGLSRVHERGGEILNLPGGTQVIPHDISKRMADGVAKAGGGGGHLSVGFDPSIGSLVAVMRDVAGQEVTRAKPALVGASVGQVRKLSGQSKSFFNR